MYLKRIDMQGFKSFANKTTIEFTRDITCIVGPNGSGKSNIADAIRWVLGEQSVKNLRGNKMEDIIFSGTKDRKALGFAEVTIVFDNESKMIPIDFLEVEVKRRLFRNGDSEYFINNTKCRFKDVRDLFFDTGIGKNGYSIVSQGKIDEILINKPEERRAIFEEASGISKFKSKRMEAERKLNNTDKNLIRLNDIIQEIKSQEEILKVESETAKKYQELFDEIKKSDIYSAAKFLYNSKEKVEKLQLEIAELEEKQIIKSNSYENINEDMEQLSKSIKEIESQIMINQKSELDRTNKENEYRNQMNLNSEKLSSLENEKKKLLLELEVHKSEIIENENSIKDLKSKLAIELLEYDEMTSSNDVYIGKLDEIKLEISTLESNRFTLDGELSSLQEEASSLEIKLRTLVSIISEKQSRLDGVVKQRELLEKNEDEIKNSIIGIENKIDELNLKIAEETEKASKSVESLNDKKLKFNSLLENLNELNNKCRSFINQRDFLSNMEDNFDGYYKSVKSFMLKTKKEKLFDSSLKGTVADLISVDEQYETAISVALGNSLQNIVVDTDSSAKEMISYLKKHNLGRVTFLPLNTIKGYKIDINTDSNQGIIGIASELVQFKSEYSNIINSILGRIIIVDNIDSASKVSKQYGQKYRVISLEGDVINVGGSLTGGSIKTNSNLLFRKNQLTKINADIKTIEAEIALIESEKDELKLEIESLISVQELNSEKLYELEKSIEKYKNNVVLLNNNSSNNDKYLKEYIVEIEDSKLFIEKSNLERIGLEQSIAKLRIEVDDANEKVRDNQANLNELREKLQTNLDANTKEMIGLNDVKNSIQTKRDSIDRLNSFNKSLEDKNSLLNAQIQENIQNFTDLEELNKQLVINYGTFKNEITDFTIENNDLISKKEAKFDELSSFQSKIKLINSELLEIDRDLNKAKFSIEKDEFKKDDIINSLINNYDYYIMDKDLLALIEDKPSLSMTNKQLKTEINNLGAVNLAAPEAYKQVCERLEFNLNQYNDLVEAKGKLQKLIKEIDSSMRAQFKESFEQINEYFKEIFKIFFDGGNANMEIAEGEDILTAGIEIKAQPPGKKLQTISLLSGGERALTAVAILFALLKTRPAPFCLLDEIDSALDEANILRYISYLRTFEDIQFAIITHRKTAMEVADVLYGVTMEEMGVSKIISMKLEN
ncbi:MAG: chromosome segregation protein SMC [Tissierellia bacterium]|nr:chromosome segregation protein SMC [Tissierellia bacterium]